MSIKEFFGIIAEKVKADIQKKKNELEKERNIALWNQIEAELCAMLSFYHPYILKLGVSEEVRAVDIKGNTITIGLPKVDLFRVYDPGSSRKICERLNQLLVKFLQYEYNRLGRLYYQQCYPNLPRIQFLAVYDHSVELIARIKLNT